MGMHPDFGGAGVRSVSWQSDKSKTEHRVHPGISTRIRTAHGVIDNSAILGFFPRGADGWCGVWVRYIWNTRQALNESEDVDPDRTFY